MKIMNRIYELCIFSLALSVGCDGVAVGSRAASLATAYDLAQIAAGPGVQNDNDGVFAIDSDVAGPAVEIVFPPPGALTHDRSVVIRGRASDPAGVATLQVNGVPATTTDGFARWRANIPLSFGANTVVVEATDAAGNISAQAAQTTIVVTQPIPGDILSMVQACGSEEGALALTPTALLRVDLTDGEHDVLSRHAIGALPLADPTDVAADCAHGRALVLDSGDVLAIDLATGHRQALPGGQLNVGGWTDPAAALAVDAAHGRAVVLQRFPEIRLLAIDLTTGSHTVLASSAIGMGPLPSAPQGMVLTGSGTRAFVVDAASSALLIVDLATGNRGIVVGTAGDSPLQAPRAVAIDEARQVAFVVDMESTPILFEVDLTTFHYRPIASATLDAPVCAGYSPRSALFDPHTERLIISAAQWGLVAIDPLTGDAGVLPDNYRGVGATMCDPASLAWDTGADRALVLDNALCGCDPASGAAGYSGGSGIVAIDLATGDRTVLSDDASAGVAFAYARAFAPDPAGGRVLVTDEEPGTGQHSALFAVDLTTGARTVLVPDLLTAPQPLADEKQAMAIDPDARAVLLADPRLPELHSVDLQARTLSLVSGSPHGGPQLSSPRSLALAGPRALVTVAAGDTRGSLLSVDLSTGARSVVSGQDDGGPLLTEPASVALHPHGDRALIVDRLHDHDWQSAVIAIDLATGDRAVVSDDATGGGPRFALAHGLVLDRDGEFALLVATDEDTRTVLLAVDVVTGERVLLSR